MALAVPVTRSLLTEKILMRYGTPEGVSDQISSTACGGFHSTPPTAVIPSGVEGSAVRRLAYSYEWGVSLETALLLLYYQLLRLTSRPLWPADLCFLTLPPDVLHNRCASQPMRSFVGMIWKRRGNSPCQSGFGAWTKIFLRTKISQCLCWSKAHPAESCSEKSSPRLACSHFRLV